MSEQNELKGPYQIAILCATIGPAKKKAIRDYVEHLEQTVHYQQRALDDKRRLTRELDVLLNGEEGAAAQALLCDIVAQVRTIKSKLNTAMRCLDAIAERSKQATALVHEVGGMRD